MLRIILITAVFWVTIKATCERNDRIKCVMEHGMVDKCKY